MANPLLPYTWFHILNYAGFGQSSVLSFNCIWKLIFILEKRLLWLWKLILLLPGTLSFEYWSRPARTKDNSACKQLCVHLITHHFGSVQAITPLIRSRSELLLFHSTTLQDIPWTHIEGKVKVTRTIQCSTNERSQLFTWELKPRLLVTCHNK